MDAALREGGLIWRVLAAWAGLRASMRHELDRGPTEGRLLFYAVLSGLIWFLGRAALLAWGPVAPALTGPEFRGAIGWELVTAVLFRTLALYVLAGAAGAVAKAAGGTGSWRDSRAALFWAALVAAPAMVAAHLLAILVTPDPGLAFAIADGLGKLIYGIVLAFCIAEAHDFRSAPRVLAAMVAIAGALVGALYLAGRLL